MAYEKATCHTGDAGLGPGRTCRGDELELRDGVGEWDDFKRRDAEAQSFVAV